MAAINKPKPQGKKIKKPKKIRKEESEESTENKIKTEDNNHDNKMDRES